MTPSVLTRRCRLDTSTAWAPCGATLALSALAAGTHTLQAQVTDPSGKQSTVVPKSWVVDATAPTAALTAPASAQTRTPATLTWTASDSGGSGLASYDLRTRYASPSAGFGAYTYPSSLAEADFEKPDCHAEPRIPVLLLGSCP